MMILPCPFSSTNYVMNKADQVKKILLSEHLVRVFYRRDGTIGWSKVDWEASDINAVREVVWLMVTCHWKRMG
jgi:hypothetical protein